jgi:hypothetical protein
VNCSRKKFVKAALINGRLASGIPGNENILGNGLAANANGLAAAAATAGVRAGAATAPGSRGSLGDSFRGSLGDTVYVPSRRSDSTTSPPPHPSKPKPWKPRSKPPPRTNFDDF